MEFIREIVDGNSLKGIVNLPKSLSDKRVEIIVLPIAEHGNERDVSKKQISVEAMMGALEEYKNPSLVEKEETAFELAMEEKYGHFRR